MHTVKKMVPQDATIAVVEIRKVSSMKVAGFRKEALQLLSGSFEDAGYPFRGVARFSLCYTNSCLKSMLLELREHLKGKYKLVLAIGAEASTNLCSASGSQDKYVGGMFWSRFTESWVLPSYHPSVIYIGPKETLNSRYDKFDILYDHILRVGRIAHGELELPPKDSADIVEWELIGDAENYYTAPELEVEKAWAVFNGWMKELDFLEDGKTKLFSLDTESRNLNVFRDKAFLMMQVYDGEKSWAFNSGVLHHPDIYSLVREFLKHRNARFTIHNAKYDYQVLHHEFKILIEILAERTVCTLAMALGTTEKAKQTGLKYLSRQYLNAPFYEEALVEYVDWTAVDFSVIPPPALAEYGCKDVFYGYHILPILARKVKEEGTSWSVKNTLLPAQEEFAQIEYEGMRTDLGYAKAKSDEWGPKIESSIGDVQNYSREQGFPQDKSVVGGQAYKAICDCVPVRGRFHLQSVGVSSYRKVLREAGFMLPDCYTCDNKRYVTKYDCTLNVNSSTHMQHLCFDILGMRELPNDGRKCNKDFWKMNANHELSKLVAEYKELQYLRRNFLDALPGFTAEDGKVHPDFLLFGTKTGRLAIHRPAMQTVPKHSKNSKEVRRCFIPTHDDELIVNVDYSSLEMYMAHHLTGDEKLLENLTGEWDVHRALAARCYKKDPADVTDKERTSVKSVNFGAGYGISGFKLALDPAMEQATGGDPNKAQEFLDEFWGMYSKWRAVADKWIEEAHEKQYLTTELGRKRRWILITGDNKNKVNNQAVNFPGQSMASDLCLHSLIRLNKGLRARGWGRVLLSVHDALLFSIKRAHMHEAVAYIKHEMCTPPFETTTPFSVDVEVGLTYGDCVGYDEKVDYMTWNGADDDL